MPYNFGRILRFITVGSVCFTLQYLAGLALAWSGVPWPVANAAGFLLSAQLNFALSSAWTWGDRATWSDIGRALRRWLSYNATALLALAVNSGVFAVTYQLIGSLPAALLGVVTGTAANYLICDLLVFRRGAAPAAAAPRPVAGTPDAGMAEAA